MIIEDSDFVRTGNVNCEKQKLEFRRKLLHSGGLKCVTEAARLMGLRVRIPQGEGPG